MIQSSVGSIRPVIKINEEPQAIEEKKEYESSFKGKTDSAQTTPHSNFQFISI